MGEASDFSNYVLLALDCQRKGLFNYNNMYSYHDFKI